MASVQKRQTARPSCLAWCSAMPAYCISVAASSASAGQAATPMQALSVSSQSASWNACSSASAISADIDTAARRWSGAASSTANSSPPRRQQSQQALAELAQQFVASRVAERVVDGGEAVEADQQQRAGLGPGGQQLLFQRAREQVAVGQSGQAVVAGHAAAVIAAAGVEQAHFQHVADAAEQLATVVGLADEILGAGFERAQAVGRLARGDQHGQILAGLDHAQLVEHAEAVEVRHLQVQQDQVVAVLAVQPGHLARVGGRGDGRVAGAGEQVFEHGDDGGLVVDDEDPGALQRGAGKGSVAGSSSS